MPLNPPDDTTGYRTRAQIRSAIYALMGWAVMATPPPGVEAFVNEQLRLAHALLWQRFPAIRLRRWFSWSLLEGERFYDLRSNDEAAGLGVPAAPALNALVGGGTLAAGDYTYRLARGHDDGTTLPGPSATVTVALNGRVEVMLPAATPGQLYWYIYGRSGTVGALTARDVADGETSWIDTGANAPGSGVATDDTTITSTALLDPYGLQEAWIERDGARTRLCQRLPHAALAREQTGWPTHFALHSALELWPAPSATEGTLRVLGRQATSAFSDDAHTPGVPDDLVQLLALAACKRHYRHPDANDYVQMQEVLLSNLTAGSHGSQRYLPGERSAESGWVEPVPTVPFD